MAQNTYSYHLKGGKTLDLEGAEPPTDEEVEALAKENGVELELNDLPTAPKIETPVSKPNIEAPPSRVEQLYRSVFDAPEWVKAPFKRASDYLTEPHLDEFPGTPQMRGFLGGALEGASSLLSPANLLTAGRGRLAQIASQVLGGSQVAHGAHELTEGNYAQGAGDIGFGLLGIAAPHGGSEIVPPRTRETPPAYKPLPPDNMNQAAILDAIKAPIVEHGRPPGKWDENLDLQVKPAILDENKLFDLARQKHGMGMDVPPELETADIFDLGSPKDYANEVPDLSQIPTSKSKVSAEFLGMQPDGQGGEVPLFNIKGGPKDRSTVTLETLKELGIEPPTFDAKAPKLSGDEIRAQEIKKRQREMDAKNKGFKGTVEEPTGDNGDIPPVKPPVVSGGETPPPIDPKIEPLVIKLAERKPEQASALSEAWNLARGLMSVDLPFITSAAFRQGLPLIGTKNWIKAWGPSIKSYGSKNFYESHLELMKNDPLMKRGQQPVMDIDGNQMLRKGRPVFKETPSIAENAGVKLTDLDSLSSREESIRSQLAERVPVWGKIVAASNRGYTAYINDLRLNAFRNMYEAMPDKNNIPALKELGEAVNVFTGRGSLKGSIRGHEANLEKYSTALSNVLFAPKLIASRLKMLSPTSYLSGTPQARMEYLKSALRTAGAWGTFAGLGSMMGGQVNLDPTNSDFGKIRIGNTRLDPAGGFQQFLVLASRILQQESTSSTSGKTTPFNTTSFSSSTGKSLQDFIANKLHPNLKKVYDAAFANRSRPYHVVDREMQSWIPMITGDLIEIAKSNPELVPALAPLVSAGMGLQNYEGKDFNKPVVTPMLGMENQDITLGR